MGWFWWELGKSGRPTRVGGQAVRYVNQMMTVKIIKFDACYSTARIDWLGFEVADALAYSAKKKQF
jgi:hypothetical protein